MDASFKHHRACKPYIDFVLTVATPSSTVTTLNFKYVTEALLSKAALCLLKCAPGRRVGQPLHPPVHSRSRQHCLLIVRQWSHVQYSLALQLASKYFTTRLNTTLLTEASAQAADQLMSLRQSSIGPPPRALQLLTWQAQSQPLK